MKKHIILLLAAAAAFSVSCNKELTDTGKVDTPSVEKIVFNVSTETSVASRAILDNKDFLWEDDDAIAIYDGTGINRFDIVESSVSEDRKSASFAGEADESESYVAIAPFSAASVQESGLMVTIPSVQTVDAAHSVDPSALLSVAKAAAAGSISLSNCFSLVRITIASDDITSVTLMGNSREKIAGDAALDVETLSIGAADSPSASLVYAGGAAFERGDYYIVIYPTVFQTGFRVILSDGSSNKALKSTSQSKTFARNGGAVLGNVTDVTSWFDGTIMDYDQLKTWAQLADTYETGEMVRLGADIDCSGNEWVPVRFGGIFDGQQHRIHGFKVQGDYARPGFIGTLVSGGEVRDVAFGSADYDFSKGSAADAGTYDNISYIQTARSSEPESWVYAAPISYAENGSVIRNVVNFMNVTSLETIDSRFRLAGIVGLGKENVTIEDCVNYGQITSSAATLTTINKNLSIAGVVGCFDKTGARAVNCVNRGNVTNGCAKVNRMGGIIGMNFGDQILSCVNYGAISNRNAAGMCAGGICGYTDGQASVFDLCSNHGTVSNDVKTSTVIAFGGVVGYLACQSIVKGCSNDAFVGATADSGNSYIGGVAGRIADDGASITKSGDVCTSNSADLTQSVNFSNAPNIGGIVGYISSSKGSSSIEFCGNSGNLGIGAAQTTKVNVYCGGIAANDIAESEFRDCSNSGQIVISLGNNNSSVYVGGITGGKTSPAVISNCSNTSYVRVNNGSSSSMAGGIAAYFDPVHATMSDCSLSSQIWIPSSGLTVSAGLLAGACPANTSGSAVTAFERCRIGYYLGSTSKRVLACHSTALASYVGLVVGKIDGACTSDLNFGSDSAPLTILKGYIYQTNSTTGRINVQISDEVVQEWYVGKANNDRSRLALHCNLAE